MNVQVDNSSNINFLNLFEKNNNFTISEYLKEAILYSNLIHLNQLNDIKNQEFNHVSFIGNYSDLLGISYPNLKNQNMIIEDKLNYVYLSKNGDNNLVEFKPNHTPFSFPCKYVENLESVFDGMVKCNNYYILLNTSNEKLELNVYAYTKGNAMNSDYYFLVLIGKLISPLPYKNEEVNSFITKYNLNLSPIFIDYLQNSFKIFGLEMDKIKKIYYLNLHNESSSMDSLRQQFDKKNKSNFDLEEYRKPLLEFWEKSILGEETEEDKNNLNKLRHEIKIKNDNFLNGFMKIGTIDNQKFNFSELNQDLVLELYLLLNVSDADKELEGTIWVYQLSDPGNSSNKDIHYLPITKMLNIGSILKFNNIIKK
jgi:hypothetical protein